MIKCYICNKELGKEFEWLESKSFKGCKFKCDDCLIKETMDKVKEDPKVFKNVCDSIREMQKAGGKNGRRRKKE